jgi:hypothetical protein
MMISYSFHLEDTAAEAEAVDTAEAVAEDLEEEAQAEEAHQEVGKYELPKMRD